MRSRRLSATSSRRASATLGSAPGFDSVATRAPHVLPRAGRAGLFALVALALLAVSPASAKVFVSQNQALREAFPDATRIERETKILLGDQFDRVKAITKDDRPAKVVVIHTAYRDDVLLGWGHIDVHNVRTKPEAFLVVLTPDGVVRSVRVLAFHEPLDYLPTDRWYGQFAGKTEEDRLRVGGDIHGVVGATLSTRAAAEGVRRMLAYYEVLLKAEPVATVSEEATGPTVGDPSPPTN